MDDSNAPLRFGAIWASGATSPYVNYPVPEAASGLDPGRASFELGFPPLTFQSISTGGVPPFGSDFNGLMFQTTAALQWLQAGGPNFYDSTFAGEITGYPKGAILASAVAVGHFWINIVDNNTSNPDTGGGGWITWPNGNFFVADTGTANAGSISLLLPAASMVELEGVLISVLKVASANNGTAGYTMTINGTAGSLGTFNVLNSNGTTLNPNQLQASAYFIIVSDGTQFRLVGGTPNLSTKTAGGTSTAIDGVLPPGNAGTLILAIYNTAGVHVFTVPADRYNIFAEVGGGGAGGAGENSGGPFTGGGGGAGGYAAAWLAVSPGDMITCTVGAGGAGGIAGSIGSSNGANGGASSIGALISCTGGVGGESGADAAGGDPGLGSLSGTIGGVTQYGGYGTDGDIAMTGAFAGNGGASFFGGGIRGARGGPPGTPAAAGSGGGGGYIAGNGSQGIPGIIVIRG